MTRDAYIQAVKAKLEEISPFDEQANFIAADDTASEVKPIESYIESELDNAARFSLNALPISLLSEDIALEDMVAQIDAAGVGHVRDVHDYMRLSRVHDFSGHWERDVVAFITTSDQQYLLQLNKYTRGGVAKPVGVWNPELSEIELYSWPLSLGNTDVEVSISYVDVSVPAEKVNSDISEYIVLACAINVADILQDTNRATALRNEWKERVAPILV